MNAPLPMTARHAERLASCFAGAVRRPKRGKGVTCRSAAQQAHAGPESRCYACGKWECECWKGQDAR